MSAKKSFYHPVYTYYALESHFTEPEILDGFQVYIYIRGRKYRNIDKKIYILSVLRTLTLNKLHYIISSHHNQTDSMIIP